MSQNNHRVNHPNKSKSQRFISVNIEEKVRKITKKKYFLHAELSTLQFIGKAN